MSEPIQENTMEELKPTPRHKSRTNQVASAIAVLGVIIQSQDVFLPFFGAYGGLVMAGLSGLMVMLREITKTPIKK